MTAPDTGAHGAPGTGAVRVVALGGGHGLAAMLQALLALDEALAADGRAGLDITAVVTVADDGGSSGRLRREVPGALPPGDLRMALAALSGSDEGSRRWTETFQHRFAGQGALTGHPVGNLMLVGLQEVLGDPVTALDMVGGVLGSRGRVLPMSRRPLEIVAEVVGLDADPGAVRRIRGQVAVASTPGQVLSVAVEPGDAPACPEALAAIAGADLVTLGPGSWFTSVLVHLLLPELAEAIQRTPAHRLLVLNLAAQQGETEGFSPERHVDVLSVHAPSLRLDTVLADRAAVVLPGRLASAAQRLGARVELRDVAVPGEPRHDIAALAASLRTVVDRIPAGRA